ncbi:MAG: MotA/TolQ/ExbB proton channel family protein [Pseudomonadota bacterium]
MTSLVNRPFGLMLLFLTLAGVEVFVIYLMLDFGLLQNLIQHDLSYLTRIILGIYLLASLHALRVAYHLSVESLQLSKADMQQDIEGHVGRYWSLLQTATDDREQSPKLLLQVLDGRCRDYYRFGYVISDLMLKLGLLGTVIGFIFMLGSLNDLNSIDINVMQKLLSQMSGGMKVALFTTLTGMSCGVLLNLKYQLFDWRVDCLMDEVRELTFKSGQS